jgi:hypothetical protein
LPSSKTSQMHPLGTARTIARRYIWIVIFFCLFFIGLPQAKPTDGIASQCFGMRQNSQWSIWLQNFSSDEIRRGMSKPAALETMEKQPE